MGSRPIETHIELTVTNEVTALRRTSDSRRSRSRIYKNVMVIGVVWTLINTIKDGVTNIQSSVNSDYGLGTAALIALYGGVVISNTFLATAVVRWLGTKWTLVWMMVIALPSIVSQYHSTFYTLIPTSLLAGLSAGPISISVNTYVTMSAEAYAHIRGISTDTFLPRLYGILLLMKQTSEVWGNLVTSAVFSSRKIESHHAINRTACGCSYCPLGKQIGHTVERPADEVLFLYVIVLCLICIVAILIAILGIDKLKSDGRTRDKVVGFRLLAITFNFLMKNRTQKLLLIVSVWLGLQQAFLTADFTSAYVTCSWGVDHIGYVLIPYGFTNALSSFATGWLVRVTGRWILMATSFFLHFVITVYLLTWSPDPDHHFMTFYCVTALWGIANGIVIVLNLSLYGLMANGEEDASFSNHELWLALGFIVGYTYSPLLCTDVKLYVMLASLFLALLAYLRIESIHR